MRKIGQGLQYVVYDLGNGRVHKVETTFPTKLATVAHFAFLWRGAGLGLIPLPRMRDMYSFARGTKSSLERSLEGLRRNWGDIPLELLGNPKLLEGHVYEQDLVTPLGTRLAEITDEAAQRALIDVYLELVLTTWRYGFSDVVFNFTINCGFARNGQVILIDLGELTWDYEEIARHVRERSWERQWSLRELQRTSVGKYAHERLNTMLTLERLAREWGSATVEKNTHD